MSDSRFHAPNDLPNDWPWRRFVQASWQPNSVMVAFASSRSRTAVDLLGGALHVAVLHGRADALEVALAAHAPAFDASALARALDHVTKGTHAQGLSIVSRDRRQVLTVHVVDEPALIELRVLRREHFLPRHRQVLPVLKALAGRMDQERRNQLSAPGSLLYGRGAPGADAPAPRTLPWLTGHRGEAAGRAKTLSF